MDPKYVLTDSIGKEAKSEQRWLIPDLSPLVIAKVSWWQSLVSNNGPFSCCNIYNQKAEEQRTRDRVDTRV
jgi:hypothetical protein